MTPARGFTLIELLIVLVLLALVAGVTMGALRTGSAVERAGTTLVTRLLDARVIAMRSGGAVLVVEEREGGLRTGVEVEGEGALLRVREVVVPGVTIEDETPDFGLGGGERSGPGGVARVRFNSSGRADARRWVLRSGDRMVAIEFDPITGVPALHRER